jgi:hypothetical protein
VAKWRDAAGQHKKVLGRDWTDKGPPPAGYLREKEAQAALQAILTDARRGTVEQLRTGLTFDLAAEQWLAWAVRDRDWKPSTLSDNRSVLNAHLLPAFAPKRIERITPDDIEQWRDELVDERGASRRTANKCLIILGAVLERAVKAHGLVRNPPARSPSCACATTPTRTSSHPRRSSSSVPRPPPTKTAPSS